MKILLRTATGIGIASILAALAVPAVFYVNIPCQDDWLLVPMVDQILSGHIPFLDFWMFQSEHRIFFPKLILCHLAAWTSWDMRAVPWLSLGLVFITTLFISKLSGENRDRRFWQEPVFWAACVFTFSLHAIKTVVWCFLFNTFLTVGLVMSALFCVAKNPESFRRWLISGLLVVVASFSFGNGLVAWFAIFPLLISARKSQHFIWILAFWIVSAAASLAFYFHGFPYSHQHPSMPFVLSDPIYTSRFFIHYLGALFFPLPPGLFGALGLGLTSMLAMDAFREKGKMGDALKGLLCVTLFVFGSGLAVSAVRSHYAIEGAVVDRYVPVSSCLWAAIAVWLIQYRRRLSGVLLILGAAIVIIAPFHWKDFKDNEQFLKSVSISVQKEPQDESVLSGLFGDSQVVSRAISILKERKLAVFKRT